MKAFMDLMCAHHRTEEICALDLTGIVPKTPEEEAALQYFKEVQAAVKQEKIDLDFPPFGLKAEDGRRSFDRFDAFLLGGGVKGVIPCKHGKLYHCNVCIMREPRKGEKVMSISLVKGSQINLEKEAGAPLTKVIMGLGWDVGAGESIDLDASCVLLGTKKGFLGLGAAVKDVIESVSFRNLRSSNASVVHSGDNLTGAGDGDDEVIKVDLSAIPDNVNCLVFTINSYRGQTFDRVQNAYVRAVNETDGKEIAKYNLSEKTKTTGLVFASVYRTPEGWMMKAIGEPTGGRTVEDIFSDVKRLG